MAVTPQKAAKVLQNSMRMKKACGPDWLLSPLHLTHLFSRLLHLQTQLAVVWKCLEKNHPELSRQYMYLLT